MLPLRILTPRGLYPSPGGRGPRIPTGEGASQDPGGWAILPRRRYCIGPRRGYCIAENVRKPPEVFLLDPPGPGAKLKTSESLQKCSSSIL